MTQGIADKLVGFTPGPWEMREADDRYESDTVPIYAGAHQVGDIYGFQTTQRPDMTVAEAEANARLIAAAPELYEALADLMENPKFVTAIGGNPNMVEELMSRASTALAKARGQ